MPYFRHLRAVDGPSKWIPRRSRGALYCGLVVGLIGCQVTWIFADPPLESKNDFRSPTHSSRRNPLGLGGGSASKIPPNDLRSTSKPASAWRTELFAVDQQTDSLSATLNLVGTLSPSLWSFPVAGVHSSLYWAMSKNADLGLSVSNFESFHVSEIEEPAKFDAGRWFVEAGDSEPQDHPPKKRELKTSDEDMRDYLAQEFESSDMSLADRSHQGVDAENAQKPALYGESRIGQSDVDRPEEDFKVGFYGTPAQQARLERVHSALNFYLDNPESTALRSPWAVMHALLAFGSDYELIGPNNQRVNAIGWMCHNGLCRTQRIFSPRGNGFVPNVGGGVQGHQGQFLAILAQCQVPPDYPIQIGERRFTVEDLVHYEMATCRERSELTFKLIGLSYYLDSDKQWRSNDGKVWSIQKLIQEELAQPILGSACGGTHRLMGYSFAIKQRVLQGQSLQGQYLRAAKFINEFIEYTWQLQNPDGSFSTNWYEGRGNEPNVERRVQTTGHMLEWLLFTVSDTDARSVRVEKAVDYILANIYDNRQLKWPIGPRGHAERALALYHKRLTDILSEPQSGSSTSQSANVAGSALTNADEVVVGRESRMPAGLAQQAAPVQSNTQYRTSNGQRVIRPMRTRR